MWCLAASLAPTLQVPIATLNCNHQDVSGFAHYPLRGQNHPQLKLTLLIQHSHDWEEESEVQRGKDICPK